MRCISSLIFLAVAGVLLCGCGGGAGSGSAEGDTPAESAARPANSQVQPETAEARADQFFAHAESTYPALLSGTAAPGQSGPFRYRYYASSGVYVGVVTRPDPTYHYEGVYVMGGPFGAMPVQAGFTRNFLPQMASTGFVTRSGGQFMLNGHVFRVAGANAAQSIANVDRSGMRSALQLSRQMGANVVRIFGGSEIGSLNGAVQTLGTNPAFRPYFQYWDVQTGAPAFNAGENGLLYLDDVIHTAREQGLRVIVALADNWDGFYGGVNQYVTWYGGTRHGQFFTDSRMKQAYKDWVRHLLMRTNTKTGLRYADDPTIMAWELLNEASCYGGDAWPAQDCHRTQVEAWVAEMAAHVKSLAPRQLVAVGDQGHFGNRDDAAMGWPYRSTNEPDFATVLAMADIDFGTYHLYPFDFTHGDGSLTPLQYGLRYIADRQAIAQAAGKPVLLEEVGARDVSVHASLFDAFLGEVNTRGGAGFVFWGIGARYATGGTVWDAQGYTIYPDSASATALKPWFSTFLAP